MLYLNNLRTGDIDYFADLLDDDDQVVHSVIIQKGGGNCDWVAINAENYNQMWEIQFVGANKLDASQWVNGDAIVLNMGIKPNSVNR